MKTSLSSNDAEKWMTSDSSGGEDDAPEEVKFEQGKETALSQRKKEEQSKRKQVESLKQKRKEIEGRNIHQKQAKLAASGLNHLPEGLLKAVITDSKVNDERKRQLEDDIVKKEKIKKRKNAKISKSKVDLPETSYEFIPLAGVSEISKKLVYKNKTANLQLNFKEAMLSSNKHVRREKVGRVLSKFEQQRSA
ncbi:hypothetical protein HDE_06463 [Halotydeus destructor]|nr:hypothetical protein HDE_06463 [Halotydeus destructor]